MEMPRYCRRDGCPGVRLPTRRLSTGCVCKQSGRKLPVFFRIGFVQNLIPIGCKPMGQAVASNEFDYDTAALQNGYDCSSLPDFAELLFA
jgi:hypothetical protein